MLQRHLREAAAERVRTAKEATGCPTACTACPSGPCLSGQGGRPLDKCLVQLHADATLRKYLAARSEAVNSSPVITSRELESACFVPPALGVSWSGRRRSVAENPLALHARHITWPERRRPCHW